MPIQVNISLWILTKTLCSKCHISTWSSHYITGNPLFSGMELLYLVDIFGRMYGLSQSTLGYMSVLSTEVPMKVKESRSIMMVSTREVIQPWVHTPLSIIMVSKREVIQPWVHTPETHRPVKWRSGVSLITVELHIMDQHMLTNWYFLIACCPHQKSLW